MFGAPPDLDRQQGCQNQDDQQDREAARGQPADAVVNAVPDVGLRKPGDHHQRQIAHPFVGKYARDVVNGTGAFVAARGRLLQRFPQHRGQRHLPAIACEFRRARPELFVGCPNQCRRVLRPANTFPVVGGKRVRVDGTQYDAGKTAVGVIDAPRDAEMEFARDTAALYGPNKDFIAWGRLVKHKVVAVGSAQRACQRVA